MEKLANITDEIFNHATKPKDRGGLTPNHYAFPEEIEKVLKEGIQNVIKIGTSHGLASFLETLVDCGILISFEINDTKKEVKIRYNYPRNLKCFDINHKSLIEGNDNPIITFKIDYLKKRNHLMTLVGPTLTDDTFRSYGVLNNFFELLYAISAGESIFNMTVFRSKLLQALGTHAKDVIRTYQNDDEIYVLSKARNVVKNPHWIETNSTREY